ncbi:hypothetical protein EYC80_009310 [Monilinia laxa]|uniref:Uncharacterized protein n=1 Tax=Monilinia laxa TaxID=61186 RepID=A0A5N6JXE8_MONLA|nr:hypothetical protein EYC80_009310 [Monilinia laxa]
MKYVSVARDSAETFQTLGLLDVVGFEVMANTRMLEHGTDSSLEMAMGPDEEESQAMAQLRYTEQEHLDNEFSCGTFGYENANVEKGYESDEEDYGSEIGMDDLVVDSQSMLKQRLPQNLQSDSNKSPIEKAQLADVEPATQSIQEQDQSHQKGIQNAGFGSRPIVEETQVLGIAIDTQVTQDTTQSLNPDVSSQRRLIQVNDQSFSTRHHTDTSPKFFSKPEMPEDKGFKYAIAPHLKKSRDPSVHTPLFVKVAVQTGNVITKSLPKSTQMPDPGDKPSTKPIQPRQRAQNIDNGTSSSLSPNNHIDPSVKLSVLEKDVVPPVQNITALKQLPGACHSSSINPIRPQEENSYRGNTSAQHTVFDGRGGTSIKQSTPEKTNVSNVRNSLLAMPCTSSPASASSVHCSKKLKPISNISGCHQISNVSSASSVGALAPENETHPVIQNAPGTKPTLEAHSHAHASSSLEVPVPDKETHSLNENNSAANIPVQMQTKLLMNPLPQAKEMLSNSYEILSGPASAAGPMTNAKALEGLDKSPVSQASHNEQPKPVGAPPSRQGTLAPIYGAQSRLRQRSSNQLNRFSAKRKFNVQGKLIRNAPFPEALSDQPKVQVYQDMPSKTQPRPQLDIQSPLAEEGLPNRIHATEESLKSVRLHNNNNATQDSQPQDIAVQSAEIPATIPLSGVKNSNVEIEDSIMTLVESEKNLPAEGSRQYHQSKLTSEFQTDHEMIISDQHLSVYQESSRPVSQANTSRPQSRLNTTRSQQAVRTQVTHQTPRKVMNRPVKPQDLEPRGVSEAVSSRSSQSKVTKTTPVYSQSDNSPISQTGDHIGYHQGGSYGDPNAIWKFFQEVQRRESVIQEQVKHIENLNAKLQDICEINAELEMREVELSRRVERLNALSNDYKRHINEVVRCQKSLKQDSTDIKKSVEDLRTAPTPLSKDIEDTEAQAKRMRSMLVEIKKAQRQQDQRDSKFKNLVEQINELKNVNKNLESNLKTKSEDLERQLDKTEKLEKQISNGEVERHKEVMGVLQKPQVDTLGELTKEDGILHKVLQSSEGVQGKLNDVSKTVKNAVSKTSAWPQTLTKSLNEFYSKIQMKLDDNGNRDTNFQESTIKLFDELKEHLNEFKGDLDEKTKLSEKLNHLQGNDATLKSVLSSKEAELENNLSRFNELTLKLADVHSQLTSRDEQLAILSAQPREDPEMNRKVDNLNAETSRLKSLLTTANNSKLQAERTVQTHQETITTLHDQLRETEKKLRTVESNMKTFEENHTLFKIESRSATEMARQEINQIALSQRNDLEAKHDILVNNLKRKQADIEKQLQAAVEESKASKKAFDDQAKNIGKIESEIATYKNQLSQQQLQLQKLEETSMSAHQILMQKQKHQQEIFSIRQEQANQLASSQAYRDESLRIKDELEGAQKRLRGMVEENDRLRQRFEGITAMAENNQMIVSNPSRVHDSRTPLRRPAERRSGKYNNVYNQRNDGFMAGDQRKVPESRTSAVLTSSFSRAHEDNIGGSLTPIKPFSAIASLDTSPLTDLEDIMPEVQTAHSQEELQQLYNKNRQELNNKSAHTENVLSKYYPRVDENLGSINSKRNAVPLAAEGGFISGPNQISKSIPSFAQESIQRRTRRPLKSAMKKNDHQDSPISLDSSQGQVYGQKDEGATATFKKPVLRNNRGLNNSLQSISRTGSSGYNRIAEAQPSLVGPRAPEQSKVAPWYEPTPEIKRNAMKRARSNPSFAAQDTQPIKPAKAPKLSHRQLINKTIISDSQN